MASGHPPQYLWQSTIYALILLRPRGSCPRPLRQSIMGVREASESEVCDSREAQNASNGMKLRDYRWGNWGSEIRSSWYKGRIGGRKQIFLNSDHRWERKNKLGWGTMGYEVMFGWYAKILSWVGGNVWLAYLFSRPFFFFHESDDM